MRERPHMQDWPAATFLGRLPVREQFRFVRSYVIDGDLKSLRSLRIASEPDAGLLPDIGVEENRWQLYPIEIIDDAETISTGRPIPNCTVQHVSLARSECAFDGCRRSVPKTLPMPHTQFEDLLNGSEPCASRQTYYNSSDLGRRYKRVVLDQSVRHLRTGAYASWSEWTGVLRTVSSSEKCPRRAAFSAGVSASRFPC